ncbi:signal peptide peptidase-like 2B [Anolis carolinensis]|uniref:signal peptide peptidase-like 2B n=1 Tax=Anolis carolinensis TaxID=28377 RepID=UPI002F2B74FE
MKDNCRISRKAVLLLAWLFLLFVPPVLAQNPGVIHIDPEKGGDYCFVFHSQQIKSHQEGNKNHWFDFQLFSQNLTYSALCCLPSFFGKDDNDGGGFSTRIASIREGNCNLFENARLHQINRTQGLLTLGGDAPYPMKRWRSAFNWGHCEEITIPGILLSEVDVLYLLFRNLITDLLYKTGIIYLMSMVTVIVGSYWAGCSERKKQHIKSQCRTESSGEITIDTNVYFTCTCAVMATFMLLSLYCLYDYMVFAMTGIYCLYASFSLYCCLAPFVSKFSSGRSVIHLPYFHKALEIRALLLVLLCISITAVCIFIGNEDVWGWILHNVLGMCIGIYLLRTIHIPNLKNCSMFLIAHLFYDTVCLFITPFLTKTGRSVTDVTGLGSYHSEKIPFLLKAPILSSASTLDNSFAVAGLGDVVLPGFLVAYCHRFDVQVGSSGVYFLASTLAYSYGLLVNFIATTFLQANQPTLLYLVPCILITILTVAAARKEVVIFWVGMRAEEDMSHPSLELKESKEQLCQQEWRKEILNITFQKEKHSSNIFTEELSDLNTCNEEVFNNIPSHEELASQHKIYYNDEM